MKLMTLMALVFVSLMLFGCENIRHKSFRTVSNAMGIKATAVDPTGSGSPAPMFMFGSLTNVITTVTPGTKMKSSTEVGSIIHDRAAFKDNLDVDTTQSGDFITTKDGVDYKTTVK